MVVALNKGLGIGLVHGFSGLTVAVAVLAPLTALAAFRELPWLPRTAAALVVGLAYVVASYFAQGAFKETIEALLVLAFALALREAGREWEGLPLRFVPAGAARGRRRLRLQLPGPALAGRDRGRLAARRTGARPAAGRRALAGLALLAFVVAVAPEIGRMVDFHSFETFDPNGPGPRQPLRPDLTLRGAWDLALGRLPPGTGGRRRAGGGLLPGRGVRDRAPPLWGLALWRASRAGDPLRPLHLRRRLRRRPRRRHPLHGGQGDRDRRPARRPDHPAAACIRSSPPREHRYPAFAAEGERTPAPTDLPRVGGGWGWPPPRSSSLAAGVCSLLALANAPVGPPSYSPALTGFRPEVAERLDRSSSARTSCSPTTTAGPTSPGSCAAGASASPKKANSTSRRRGSATWSPKALPATRRSRARGQTRRQALRALGSDRAAGGQEPLPADRRAPGPPGPALSATTLDARDAFVTCTAYACKGRTHSGRRTRRPRTITPMEAATEKVVVSLPDGKPLELEPGATGRRRRRGDRAGAGQGRAGDQGRRRAARPRGAAPGRRRDRDRHRPRPRGPRADPPRRRPRDGRGGHRALSRGQGDDRAADRVRLLLRLRVPARDEDHRGGAAEDRAGDAGPHRRRRVLLAPRRPGRRGDRDLPRPGPGLQGRADRGPGRATKASRPSRSTATAPSRTSAAARTRPRPAGSRRSSSPASPAPTGAATRTASS